MTCKKLFGICQLLLLTCTEPWDTARRSVKAPGVKVIVTFVDVDCVVENTTPCSHHQVSIATTCTGTPVEVVDNCLDPFFEGTATTFPGCRSNLFADTCMWITTTIALCRGRKSSSNAMDGASLWTLMILLHWGFTLKECKAQTHRMKCSNFVSTDRHCWCFFLLQWFYNYVVLSFYTEIIQGMMFHPSCYLCSVNVKTVQHNYKQSLW